MRLLSPNCTPARFIMHLLSPSSTAARAFLPSVAFHLQHPLPEIVSCNIRSFQAIHLCFCWSVLDFDPLLLHSQVIEPNASLRHFFLDSLILVSCAIQSELDTTFFPFQFAIQSSLKTLISSWQFSFHLDPHHLLDHHSRAPWQGYFIYDLHELVPHRFRFRTSTHIPHALVCWKSHKVLSTVE